MKNLIQKSRTALLVLCLLAWNSMAQNEIAKIYTGIEKIQIEGGSLEISYIGDAGKQDISLNAYLGEEEDIDKNLVFITIGNTLKISYQNKNRQNWNWNKNTKRYIHISGPETVGLDIKNSSGKVLVDRVRSEETKITVSSGLMEVNNIHGNLIAKGSSGKIVLKNISGNVNCRITSGVANIRNVKGDLHYSSTSGKLNAEKIEGETHASLSSGVISLKDVKALGKMEISSGSIRAVNAGLGANTSFNGSSGSMNITTPSDLKAFNFDLKANSGTVKVGNTSTSGKQIAIHNGAAHTIKGSISSGSIRIQEL